MFNKIGLLAVRFMRWISSVWRNFLGTILGLIVGGNVNIAIVNISTDIIPGPAGADVKTMEGLQKSIHLFEPKHFLMPFLAHALGTLVAALLASLIAKSHRKRWRLQQAWSFSWAVRWPFRCFQHRCGSTSPIWLWHTFRWPC